MGRKKLRSIAKWKGKVDTKGILDRRKSVRLGCLNVNGFTDQSHHDILEAIEAKQLDIFSVVETKLSASDSQKLQLEGFEVVEARREEHEKKGGGLAVFMRKSSNVGFSKYAPKIEDEELQYVASERLWITFQTTNGKTALCTIYLGFQHSDNRHEQWNRGILEVVGHEVRDLRGRGFKILLQGDFNCWVGSSLNSGGIPGNNTLLPNKNGVLFLDFLAVNHLTHVNGAVREEGNWDTRFCKGKWTRHSSDHSSSTILDYVVISSEHLTSVKEMIVDEEGSFGGHSDHNMCFTSLLDNFVSTRRTNSSSKRGWDFNENTDMSKFRSIVQRELEAAGDANLGPGVNNLSNFLTSALLKGLNEGIGRRKVISGRATLFPRNIALLLKERKKLEGEVKSLKSRFARSRNGAPPPSLAVAKERLAEKSEELEKAKAIFYRQKRKPLLNLSKSRSRVGRKRFWDFVSRRNNKSSDIDSLQDKKTGILKNSPEEISEEVQKYLETIFSSHEAVMQESSGTQVPEVGFGPPTAGPATSELPSPIQPQVDHNETPPTTAGQIPEVCSGPPTAGSASRDHEYGHKTNARLPTDGHGIDPSVNPQGFLNRPFTYAEVSSIINKLKGGKAAGHDEILNEALKEAPESFVHMLTTLFNRVQEQSEVPSAWKRGRVVLIHKKGAKHEVNNYRPLTVLTSMNSVFSKTMNARLSDVVERHRLLGEVQNGFRKGRSGGDSAFILNTILWKSSSKQKKVHVSFLDLQKAYDSVDRQVLWSKLRKLGIGGKFLDSIISLYSGDFVTSTVNGVSTNPVYLGRGLRQGCSLSPLLFALYIVDMSRDLVASNLGVILKKICIYVLFFADDVALIARTPEGLRKLHHIMQKHCRDLNMKLSTSKSKVMSSCSDAWELFEEDEIIGCLEKVLNFRYLGVETSLHPYQAAKAMRKRATQISNRYKGACLRIARDGPDIVDLAASLWTSIAIPSMLYGCETVPFTNKALLEISRHQASIGKFCLGLPPCAPNVSAEIILGIKPFKQVVFASQLKFYVKLSLQDEDRWAKDALWDNLEGGWSSPYIKLLIDIKKEIGMRRWPRNAREVDIVLDNHFLVQTNQEIERLSLPAVMPLTKRARMEHVNETSGSQVESKGFMSFYFDHMNISAYSNQSSDRTMRL